MVRLEHIDGEVESVFREGQKAYDSLKSLVDDLRKRYSQDRYLNKKLDALVSEAETVSISMDKLYLASFSGGEIDDLLPETLCDKLADSRITFAGGLLNIINKWPGDYVDEGFGREEITLLRNVLKEYGLRMKKFPSSKQSPFIKDSS